MPPPRKENTDLARVLDHSAFTLAEAFSPHSKGQRRVAFTLAEVLITLGIIGVVAALTMPTLIQNHRNHVVETRLQKFYSAINQAITRAEVDYGDRREWFESENVGKDVQKEWIDKYLVPYMNVVDKKYIKNLGYTIYFADGSALMVSHQVYDWFFFPGDPEKCINKYNNVRKCSFTFFYSPTTNKDFALYDYSWDHTENSLKYDSRLGCYSSDSRAYCGKLIQYNGWKIPKDCPFKFYY